MAERRMFSKAIIDSDAFLEMPITTRLLYYDLAVRADDDGFVDAPMKIIRIVGTTQDDLDNLIEHDYVIRFDTGIIVITHWHIHNYIQPDRYHPTQYQEEKALLTQDGTKAYKMVKADSKDGCIQPVSKMYTESRSDKSRSGKPSVSQTPTLDDIKVYCKDHKINIDPNRFYSYYEARGWILNGEPVHSWRALIDIWAQKEPSDNSDKAEHTKSSKAKEQLELLKAEKQKLIDNGASNDDIDRINTKIMSIEDSIALMATL